MKLLKRVKHTLFFSPHDRATCLVCQGPFLDNIIAGAIIGLIMFGIAALITIITSVVL